MTTQSTSLRKPGLHVGVVTAYPPSRNSLNEYGLHLVEAIRRDPRVAQVTVFADKHDAPAGSEAAPEGVLIHRCWEFGALANGPVLFRAARQARVDAVVFNSHFRSFSERSVASAVALLAAPLLSAIRTPTILILHNIVEAVDLVSTGMVKNRWLARLAQAAGTLLTRLLLCVDTVSVLLPSYAEILSTKYGNDNVMHIPHGAFGEARSEPAPRPAGKRRILAFGKFGTYKKVELMIEAVELLRQRGHGDLEVVVAGSDSPNTPGYLESVRTRYAHVADLSFTGYLAEADVEPTLASATVVVLPYTSTTGSSGVLHQVGQVGRAAVLPDIGDLAVLIRSEGYAGETFEATSVHSLADAIDRILRDDVHRQHLEITNLQASRALGIGQVARRYVDEVERLLSGRKVARAKGTLRFPSSPPAAMAG